MSDIDSKVPLRGGESLIIHHAAPQQGKNSFYGFALAKSGSTMLTRILDFMCEANGVAVVNVEDALFAAGANLTYLTPECSPLFEQEGCGFIGFRHFPTTLKLPLLEQRQKIMLIRDPRDMLVSLYFSHRNSHPIPKNGPGKVSMEAERSRLLSMSIDQYVLERGPSVLASIKEYRPVTSGTHVMLRRYEDIIFSKDAYIRELEEFLELPLRADQRARLREQVDLRPEHEDPTQHVRRVTPGDHIEKLSPETVVRLNELFYEVLAQFEYA